MMLTFPLQSVGPIQVRFQLPDKFDVFDPASFILIPETLHSAIFLFGPCVKLLKPEVLANSSAAASVLATLLL